MKSIVFLISLAVGLTSLVMINRTSHNEETHERLTLTANIGMPMDEVRRRSSQGLIGTGVRHDSGYQSFVQEQKEFDWEVAGTGLRFPKCKYFWMDTGKANDPRVVFMWVTTAQKKLTYAELKAEMLSIQERILADGWRPARYNDGRKAEVELQRDLENAKPNSLGKYGAIAYYAKGDVVMCFIGTQIYTDPLIVKDPMRQDIFYHRIELEPRSKIAKEWGGDFFP